jgi:hypothetical protein
METKKGKSTPYIIRGTFALIFLLTAFIEVEATSPEKGKAYPTAPSRYYSVFYSSPLPAQAFYQ